MTRAEFNTQRERTLELFEKAGVIITDKEKENIEVCDFEIGIVEKVVVIAQHHIGVDLRC